MIIFIFWCFLFILQKNVHSKAFVSYICCKVLPGLQHMVSPDEATDTKLDMLKQLAEIVEYNGLTAEEVKDILPSVYTTLLVRTLKYYCESIIFHEATLNFGNCVGQLYVRF